MAHRRQILIGCPQYRVLVRGTCEGDDGEFCIRGGDGAIPLHRVRCGQYGGRCMQTLCALHRYNRGGVGSWYPTGLYAPNVRPSVAPADAHRSADEADGWYA